MGGRRGSGAPRLDRLGVRMEAARRIRNAVAEVSLLRQAVEANPVLETALAEVKSVQSRRFSGTYADLLAGGPYRAAARFFLDELYSDKDYAQRDAQFSRIAGAIEKLFPAQVVDTAVAMAELHAVTEELDQAMALAWLGQADERLSLARRYIMAWREVGRRSDRENQLSVVMAMGEEMDRLTHLSGLRMMLRMMRGPATAAGLRSLQRFLETGFDTFAAMAKSKGGTDAVPGHHQGPRELADPDAVRRRTCRLRDRTGARLGTSPLTRSAGYRKMAGKESPMEKYWLKSYPEGVPHDVDPGQYRSLTQLLEESFKKNAARPFSVCMERWMTYGQLDDVLRRAGRLVAGPGTGAGRARGHHVAEHSAVCRDDGGRAARRLYLCERQSVVHGPRAGTPAAGTRARP